LSVLLHSSAFPIAIPDAEGRPYAPLGFNFIPVIGSVFEAATAGGIASSASDEASFCNRFLVCADKAPDVRLAFTF
jgi:hypothetical protein